MTNKKVEIIIDVSMYSYKEKEGIKFTSVDYTASTYGGASPCDNEDEIKRAIQHAKEIIISNGDKPVIVDKREAATLKRFETVAEIDEVVEVE